MVCFTTSPSSTVPASVRPHRSLVCRPLDLLYLVYFVQHIPATLFVDSQILFPTEWFPKALTDLAQYWLSVSGDPLFAAGRIGDNSNLTWLYTFMVAEFVFQLPFFGFAIRGLYRDSPCIRLPLALYGAHVATAVAPILTSIWFGYPDLTTLQRYTLSAAYVPYFIIPVLMVVSNVCALTCGAHAQNTQPRSVKKDE
ncbi:Transmembrane protein 97 [Dimargaris verticillata]|uniref:Transmembrane protein 97 n=1 Tax=Dimargaris verticillata TaxID=2761393 RepID=A0A9W8EF43_9FUNG|nr:Transmembrane protein 97 [Dimargaris verticillata]